MKQFLVRCDTPGCPNRGEMLNKILVGAGRPDYESRNLGFIFADDFCEENATPKDFCPECHKLGVLGEPEPIVEFPPDPDEEFFLAKVKLDKFVPVEDTSILDPRLVSLTPIYRYGLPTERVLWNGLPEIVIPYEARVYRMIGRASCKDGFAHLISKAKEHAECQEAARQKCSWHGNDVYLVEVWGDYGDDGHVEYRLLGWRAVTEERLRREEKEEKKAYRGSLPQCMLWDPDDREEKT